MSSLRSPEQVVLEVLRCALSWEPKSHLLGDVTAEELVAMASAFAIYHRDLCASMQLDPARATPEQVIGLVAALTARLEVMTEKRGRCARIARAWRQETREWAADHGAYITKCAMRALKNMGVPQ